MGDSKLEIGDLSAKLTAMFMQHEASSRGRELALAAATLFLLAALPAGWGAAWPIIPGATNAPAFTYLTKRIIRIAANVLGFEANRPEPPYETLRVSNLTLDGTAPNAGQPASAIEAIGLGGRYSRIFDVRAINCRGRACPYKEAFILWC